MLDLFHHARGVFLVVEIAENFAKPLPPTGLIDPNRKRGWTSKRVSNAKLRALGWQPRQGALFDEIENGVYAEVYGEK